MPDFLSLGISEKYNERLRHFGVASPTPIQERAIPVVLEGTDMIAQAQTGTGKTFAFVLPILEKINLDSAHVQALIITPTRELALQITEEIEKLTSGSEGNHVLAVYGGQDVEKQLKKLKRGRQIVVGTPGRLLDHIRRETVDFSKLSHLVLDEADQMLHIGFLNEVEDIIQTTPESRQTMLFSATMPPEIRQLAKKYMHNPAYIQVEKTQGPAQSVKQLALHVTDRAKQATIIQLVETHRPFLAVIFCRTKRRVSKLYEILRANGFSCNELHGDLSQAKREQVMKRFREAEIQLLIATDVAARGLDVEGVTHVFNYDIPLDAESYVHRIGRTGRAGMKGLAITFYSSADRPTLDMIEKELQITIPKQNLGNDKEEQEYSKERKPDRQRKSDNARNQQQPRRRDAKDERGKSAERARKPQGKQRAKRDSSSPSREYSNRQGAKRTTAQPSQGKNKRKMGTGRRK